MSSRLFRREVDLNVQDLEVLASSAGMDDEVYEALYQEPTNGEVKNAAIILVHFGVKDSKPFRTNIRMEVSEAKKLLRCDAGNFLDWGKPFYLLRRSSCEAEGKVYTFVVFANRDPKEVADRGLVKPAAFLAELKGYNELSTKKYLIKTNGPPFSSATVVESIAVGDPIAKALV
jgi:hypothetical protein